LIEVFVAFRLKSVLVVTFTVYEHLSNWYRVAVSAVVA
jgi:hypothetical protein